VEPSRPDERSEDGHEKIKGSSMEPLNYNRMAGKNLGRLEALSDGVFAVALTLLVLDLKTPLASAVHSEADLWAALLALSPKLLTYLMSFVTLGIFWLGQQAQLNLLERSNRDVVWVHIGFLAAVCLIPFSTALLSEFMVYRLALLAYWANIFLLGMLLLAAWKLSRLHKLAKPDLPAHIDRAIYARIIVAQCLYAVGAALCVFSTSWSVVAIVLLQANYALAPRIGKFALP
jgi:uncharacterized membrane protein